MRNILIVDDNLANIQVGIGILKEVKEYHLIFATGGKQALERISEIDFDLILTDVSMPEMDGFELCRRVKSNDLTKDIPVLFLSARTETESLVKGFDAGGADYILKPFNSKELLARVKTQIDLFRQYKNEIKHLSHLVEDAEKIETVKYLANALIHDCRNSVTAISGTTDIIRESLVSGQDPEEILIYFKSIYSSVEMISQLLLQFKSYLSGKESPCQKIDINTVLFELEKIVMGMSKKNIEYVTRYFDGPAPVYANKLQMEQVLLNLVINAGHAIEAGRKTGGLISVRGDFVTGKEYSDLDSDREYVRISVSDNGTGMTKETAEKIFTPYFSTRKESGGTGLGLSVASNIVKSYNGIISVNSETGRGSEFEILLEKNI